MSCSKHSVTVSYSKTPLLKFISLNYEIKFKNGTCVCVHMCICLQRSEITLGSHFSPSSLLRQAFLVFGAAPQAR